MAKEITSNYEMACLKWKEVFKKNGQRRTDERVART
ncbi:hypothetical protein HMPREF0977_01766 [Clostridium sp. 1_1_41A1FAA]|nr:hypothetical protein HMPREF0977_01766 [Clostridium sp. 1_1_41A1FAA]